MSYWPIVSALYPNATAEWVNGQAEVKADGLTLHIKPGAQYIEANGRYLYVPDGVKCEGYSIMVPIRTLCQALGAGVEWDGTQSTIQITSGSGAPSSPVSRPTRRTWCTGSPVSSMLRAAISPWTERLQWVMWCSTGWPAPVPQQRLRSDLSAQPVHPAANGSINRTPSAESVVAAKLCLDGANTAGSALYFVNPTVAPGSWASRNRPYVATIGAHAFYG